MVTLGRILKDYRDTGSLAGALALWGFVDEHTFLTKAGAVGVVYRLAGADVECLDHPERQAIARRFEQALRQLDETCRRRLAAGSHDQVEAHEPVEGEDDAGADDGPLLEAQRRAKRRAVVGEDAPSVDVERRTLETRR